MAGIGGARNVDVESAQSTGYRQAKRASQCEDLETEMLFDLDRVERPSSRPATRPMASPRDDWFRALHAPPMIGGNPVDVYSTVVVKNISRVRAVSVTVIVICEPPQVDVVNEMAYVSFTVNLYWYDYRVPKMELTPAGGLPRNCSTLWRPGILTHEYTPAAVSSFWGTP